MTYFCFLQTMANQWLQNKKIVIIGGTHGLGLSAAKACIGEGAKVMAVGRDINDSELSATAYSKTAWLMKGDARSESLAKEAIEKCAQHFGGFDGIYHVAGGSGRKFGDGPLHAMSLEGWQQTLDLNLTSLMFSNRAAIQFFLDHQQPGVILNMGSVLGYSPSPKYFSTHAYAACKAAVIGFSKSIAAYYAANNIRVNVIAPGLIKTPMSGRASGDEAILEFIHSKQPLDGGRIGFPEDSDGAAVFLLSDLARFVTGQVIAVDGGWTVSEGQY